MTIRIDNDIKITPTSDPLIFMVDASVTKDAVEVTDPKIHKVHAKWNKNTGNAGLVTALEKAIPVEDTSLEDSVKAVVCETLVATSEPEPKADPDYTINATNVTVNQVV